MIPEHLVKKYNYTYVQSCNLLNEPFVKDLLESRERVDKMNKQLLSKLDNYDHIVDERDELKKQLEHCYCNRTDCSGRIKDSKQYDSLVQKVEAQQQEFIKYLEDDLKEKYRDMGYRHNVYKEILQKYKEIIGSDN